MKQRKIITAPYDVTRALCEGDRIAIAEYIRDRIVPRYLKDAREQDRVLLIVLAEMLDPASDDGDFELVFLRRRPGNPVSNRERDAFIAREVKAEIARQIARSNGKRVTSKRAIYAEAKRWGLTEDYVRKIVKRTEPMPPGPSALNAMTAGLADGGFVYPWRCANAQRGKAQRNV